MTPESSLSRAVQDLLIAERVWFMRCQSGAQVLEHNGKKRVFRSGRVGMADLLAIVRHEVCNGCGLPFVAGITRSRCCGRSSRDEFTPLWLELKSPAGRQAPAQKEFQREVEEEGHIYLLVRDANEVIEWLRRNR